MSTFTLKNKTVPANNKVNSVKGGSKMDISLDYDRALYYTYRSEWDNLIILMVRTKDNMLSKRIERFMHAYNFSKDYSLIERQLYSLLRYLDHANDVLEIKAGIRGERPYQLV